MSEPNVILVMGNKPDSGRIIPLYCALERAGFSVTLSARVPQNAQLVELLALFSIKPELEITLCSEDTELDAVSSMIHHMRPIVHEKKTSLVIIEDEDEISVAAALAAFYLTIPVAQIHAGIPPADSKQSIQRKMISLLAQYHFAATAATAAHILASGMRREQVFNVGNTYSDLVNDLCAIFSLDKNNTLKPLTKSQQSISHASMSLTALELNFLPQHPFFRLLIVLEPRIRSDTFYAMFYAVVHFILERFVNICIVFADKDVPLAPDRYHHERFVRCPVTNYVDTFSLLTQSDSVLTDSFFLHEEGTSLDKPVLLAHSSASRIETIWAGLTYTTEWDTQKICGALQMIIKNDVRGKAGMLYGLGSASERIAALLVERLKHAPPPLCLASKAALR